MISIPFASLLLFVATLSQTVQADWNPQCNTDYISDIPYDVFSGPFGNVYTQFCGAVNQYNAHQPVSWTVNRTGGQISNIPPAQADVDAASGPGPYSFTFDLSYTPTARQKICTPNHTCQQVYAAFANSCGHNGNNLNHMAHSGTFAVGCGIYSYSIFPLKALGKQQCYPLDFFGKHHMKIQQWVLEKLIRETICVPRPRLAAQDPSTFVRKTMHVNGAPYVFNSFWAEGCYQREMSADFLQPIEGRDDINCSSLFTNDYSDCSANDGVGGNITAGCIVYEYMTTDQRVRDETKTNR